MFIYNLVFIFIAIIVISYLLYKIGRLSSNNKNLAIDLATNNHISQEKDTLILQIEAKNKQIVDLQTTNATIKSQLVESEKYYKQQVDFVNATKEQMTKDFKAVASEIIDKDREKLTTKNADTLLPLKDEIRSFKDRIEKITSEQIKDRSSLLGEIKNLQQTSVATKQSADNLADALTYDNKKQGNWGEMVLETILENSGLEKNKQYETQKAYKNEAGERLLPDVIIYLPDNKHIVIDSKVSLKAYQEYIANQDNKDFLKQHIKSIETHINNISLKEYERLLDLNTLDFILVFIPIESALLIALEEKQDLFTKALNKNIMLTSPSTLTMSLKIINHIWKTDEQNKNTDEIVRQAQNMYDKFVSFSETLNNVGVHLNKANQSHEQAIKQLKTGKDNLFIKAEKLKKLGLQTKKQLNYEN